MKMKLQDLKVKSFCTLESEKSKAMKGGAVYAALNFSDRYACNYAPPRTYDLNECLIHFSNNDCA